MDFDLLRLSLIERQQQDLFASQAEPPSREVWLREIFSNRIEFIHRADQFYFVPLTPALIDLIQIAKSSIFEK